MSSEEHDPHGSIDWNLSGQSFEDIAKQFDENPWKVAIFTKHGTPLGIVMLETYARTFREANIASDIAIRAAFDSKGGMG